MCSRDDVIVTARRMAALGLVTGQRLVRTLCRICKVAAEPPPTRTLAELLVQNARLEEKVSGKEDVITAKNETISELKEDKGFIRNFVKLELEKTPL